MSEALLKKYKKENKEAKEVPEKTNLEKLPNPTGWRILVMPFKVKEKTEGGIIIAQETLDRARVATQVGYVFKMGDLCKICRVTHGNRRWRNKNVKR